MDRAGRCRRGAEQVPGGAGGWCGPSGGGSPSFWQVPALEETRRFDQFKGASPRIECPPQKLLLVKYEDAGERLTIAVRAFGVVVMVLPPFEMTVRPVA